MATVIICILSLLMSCIIKAQRMVLYSWPFTNSTDNWLLGYITSGSAIVTDSKCPGASKCFRLTNDDEIHIYIDTRGYSDIQIGYDISTSGLDRGNSCKFNWIRGNAAPSDYAKWTNEATHDSDTAESILHTTLSTAVANYSSVGMDFWANMGSNAYCYLNNVVITGVPTSVSTLDPSPKPTQSPISNPTQPPISNATQLRISTYASTTNMLDTDVGSRRDSSDFYHEAFEFVAANQTLISALAVFVICCAWSCVMYGLYKCCRRLKRKQSISKDHIMVHSEINLNNEIPQIEKLFTAELGVHVANVMKITAGNSDSDNALHGNMQCEACGKHTESIVELDGVLYCIDCRGAYYDDDDDDDENHDSQPVPVTNRKNSARDSSSKKEVDDITTDGLDDMFDADPDDISTKGVDELIDAEDISTEGVDDIIDMT